MAYGDNIVNVEAAKLEKGLCDILGNAFEQAGKKVDTLGNALTELGVHIESSGHFSPDGSGKMTLTITSAINPVVPPASPTEGTITSAINPVVPPASPTEGTSAPGA